MTFLCNVCGSLFWMHHKVLTMYYVTLLLLLRASHAAGRISHFHFHFQFDFDLSILSLEFVHITIGLRLFFGLVGIILALSYVILFTFINDVTPNIPKGLFFVLREFKERNEKRIGKSILLTKNYYRMRCLQSILFDTTDQLIQPRTLIACTVYACVDRTAVAALTF